MLQAREIRSALRGLIILLLTVTVALGGGYLLAEFGPLLAAAGLVALVLAVWMLRDIEMAYWAVIGVVCLLPFATFPFEIGFRPTFLDAALGMLFVVWALRWMTDNERAFTATGLGGPVLLFLLVVLTAFVLGLGHAPLTAYILRRFAEILLSMLLFFVVVNTVQDVGRLQRLVRALILCAFAEAVLGILLYAIPDDWAIRALSALQVVGYPSGPGVLRYIQDDPTLPQRATATSVDPNILGSLMNLSLALAVPQLFARRPIIRRRYLVPILGALALCLGLTISRGSMVGAGVALVVVATLRYRKLWGLLLAGGVLLLVLPQTQTLVAHFIAGLRGEDLATQMRFGEYEDAITLILRYPVLGVGFAGSPDVDTYIGVSNLYMMIAQQTGLVGLTAFLGVIGVFMARFWRARAGFRWGEGAGTDAEGEATLATLEPLWWGLHAAVIGALVGGIFDHYFFNLDFHHSATLFWLIIGLATAATELARRKTLPYHSQSGGGYGIPRS